MDQSQSSAALPRPGNAASLGAAQSKFQPVKVPSTSPAPGVSAEQPPLAMSGPRAKPPPMSPGGGWSSPSMPTGNRPPNMMPGNHMQPNVMQPNLMQQPNGMQGNNMNMNNNNMRPNQIQQNLMQQNMMQQNMSQPNMLQQNMMQQNMMHQNQMMGQNHMRPNHNNSNNNMQQNFLQQNMMQHNNPMRPGPGMQHQMQQGGMHHGGMHQGGMHQGGMHQGGMHQSGMHQGGMHQGGMHQGGMHQGGMHQGGMHQGGMHQGGMHQGGMHHGGMHQGGMQQQQGMQQGMMQGSGGQAPHGMGQHGMGMNNMPPHGMGQMGVGQPGYNYMGMSQPGGQHGGAAPARSGVNTPPFGVKVPDLPPPPPPPDRPHIKPPPPATQPSSPSTAGTVPDLFQNAAAIGAAMAQDSATSSAAGNGHSAGGCAAAGTAAQNGGTGPRTEGDATAALAARLQELRRIHPDIEVPQDAWCWSEQDLEAFFSSGGTKRPQVDGTDEPSPKRSRRDPEAVEYEVPEALRIQARLREGFADSFFQDALKRLQRRYPERKKKGHTDGIAYFEAFEALALSVHARVLPDLGLTADWDGVREMITRMSYALKHPKVKKAQEEINVLMGLPRNATFTPPTKGDDMFMYRPNGDAPVPSYPRPLVQDEDGDEGHEFFVEDPDTGDVQSQGPTSLERDIWYQVLHKPAVVIRAKPDFKSDMVGRKKFGKRIRVQQSIGGKWLQLHQSELATLGVTEAWVPLDGAEMNLPGEQLLERVS